MSETGRRTKRADVSGAIRGDVSVMRGVDGMRHVNSIEQGDESSIE